MQNKSLTERYNAERQRLLAEKAESNRRLANLGLQQEMKDNVKAPPLSRDLQYHQDAVSLAKHVFSIDGDQTAYERAMKVARRQHTALHEAVIRSDYEAVVANLNEEWLDLATVNGLTALHLAVYAYGLIQKKPSWSYNPQVKPVQERIVSVLIEAGAQLDRWDDQARLPAACIDGGRLPEGLVQAMENLRLRTETLSDGDVSEDEDGARTRFNAFISPEDKCSYSLRGSPGNRTGRGGNPRGITKIDGSRYMRGQDQDGLGA